MYNELLGIVNNSKTIIEFKNNLLLFIENNKSSNLSFIVDERMKLFDKFRKVEYLEEYQQVLRDTKLFKTPTIITEGISIREFNYLAEDFEKLMNEITTNKIYEKEYLYREVLRVYQLLNDDHRNRVMTTILEVPNE